MIDYVRLTQLLGGEQLSWLVDRVAARMVRGASLDGVVTLHRATEAQRDAIDRLLGRAPTRGASLSVPLAALEGILVNAGICTNLYEAIEALAAEQLTLHRERIASESAWSAALATLEARCASNATVRVWLARLRETGVLARIAGRDPEHATHLVEFGLRLCERLPGRAVPLPELAADLLNDAHALDAATPYGTIAMHFIAVITSSSLPTDAAQRRDAWAAVGVLCDDLSSSVLSLNLPAVGDSPAARSLRFYREMGEPCRVLLRHVMRDPPAFDTGHSVVFVCENPAVVAAAAQRLGIKTAPLVCTEGQPTTAVRLLLDQLSRSGCRLLYHGDFDWPGIQIANLMHARHSASAWRMSVEDYCAAPKAVPLEGAAVEAHWDGRLASCMTEDGRSVHEEQVLATLLGDLAE
jgi:uncharacterized protein (TIGR02679 family)